MCSAVLRNIHCVCSRIYVFHICCLHVDALDRVFISRAHICVFGIQSVDQKIDGIDRFVSIGIFDACEK